MNFQTEKKKFGTDSKRYSFSDFQVFTIKMEKTRFFAFAILRCFKSSKKAFTHVDRMSIRN